MMQKILISFVFLTLFSPHLFASIPMEWGHHSIRNTIGMHLQAIALSPSPLYATPSFIFFKKYFSNVSLEIPFQKIEGTDPTETPWMSGHGLCNFCSHLSSESDSFAFKGSDGMHYETPLWSLALNEKYDGFYEKHTAKERELRRYASEKHEFSFDSYKKLSGVFHIRQNLWEILHCDLSWLSFYNGRRILSIFSAYTYNSFLAHSDLPWHRLLLSMDFEWLIDELWQCHQSKVSTVGARGDFYILKPERRAL